MAHGRKRIHTVKRENRAKRTDSTAAAVCRFLRGLLDYGICLYFILILAVMPFYFRDGYSHIGTDKAEFFCKVSAGFMCILLPVTAVHFAIRAAVLRREGRAWKFSGIFRNRTDFFAALYGAALVISYLCSRHKEVALWGAERWYMGFWPQMFLILVYFLVSVFWKPRKWMFGLMMAAAAVVFVLGYLNRFSVYPLQMKLQNPQFISTIGNINWYCGYVVPVLTAGVGLLWLKNEKFGGGRHISGKVRHAACALYVLAGFGTLATQGSDSGIVALVTVLLAMFCMSAPDAGMMLALSRIMLLLCGACAATLAIWKAVPERMNYRSGGMDILLSVRVLVPMTIVSFFFCLWVYRKRKKGTYSEKKMRYLAFGTAAAAVAGVVLLISMAAVNTVRPGSLGPLSSSPLFTLSEAWGSNRGATWKAGWMTFTEQDILHKLTGVGPDAMWEEIRIRGSEGLQEMIKRNFGNLNLVNAHNEWLTILVNTGLLGLTGFAGMMVTGIAGFLREGRRNPFACVCGLCLLGYTVNNIFSFQQAMGVAVIFSIFGMGRAFQKAGIV